MTTLDQIINKPDAEQKDKPQPASPPGTVQKPIPGGIIEQKQRNETMDDANQKLSNAAGAIVRKDPIPTESQPAQAPATPQRISMEEFIRRMNPQPTEEELEAERKKEKREKLFSAISDGISSLANLYFTTQYAPNMYNPNSSSASKKTRERWERLAAQRNANMKAYIDDLMKAKMYDDNYNDNQRKWMRQLALDDDARKRAAAEEKRKDAEEARKQAAEEREKELAPLKKKLMDHQITQAKYKAEKDRIDAKYAEGIARSTIARNNRANRGSSTSSRAEKKEDHQNAYNYWVSLSDKEKNQYRDWYKRSRQGKIGEEYGMAKYGTIYDKDDDDFIDAVWEYRKAYLRNQGRDDEIATGGYNKKNIAGFGNSSGKQTLPGFGGN